MSTSTLSNHDSQTSWASHLTKSCYQGDQQVKFMSLQAEIESLLQKLQSLQRQRLGVTEEE